MNLNFEQARDLMVVTCKIHKRNPNLSFPRYSIIELTCYSNEVQRRYICLGEL